MSTWQEPPRLYTDLAAWWPLLSPPSHYVEEAADLLPEMLAAPDAPPRTLLELGCGGGSLAYHLKSSLQLTLSDRSPQMLAGADGRGLRYMEWTWDPDPGDDTYDTVFAFLLRESNGLVRADSDYHRLGLFSRAAWLTWFDQVGFVPSSRMDPWRRDVFRGIKRRAVGGVARNGSAGTEAASSRPPSSP